MKDSFEFTTSQRTKYDSSTAVYSSSPCDFLQREMPRERELWSRKITVKGDIEKEMQMAMFAKASEVIIRLTESQDPLFLFLWELEERDYPLFRIEQQLRVEFVQFAGKLAQLLDLASGRKEKSITGVAFSIKAVRKEPGRLQLCVSESNDFKELDHISLLFCAADDERLKKHLASRVHEIADELSSAHTIGDSLRVRLETALAEKAELRSALDEVDGLRRIAEEARKKDFAVQLEQEHEKFLTEKARLEEKLRHEEKTLAEFRLVSEKKISDAQEESASFLVREKDLKLRFKATEAELQIAVQDLERLRRNLRETDSQSAQFENELLIERQKVLKARQLQEKLEGENRDLRAALDRAEEKLLRVETELQDKGQFCGKLESKLKLSSAEINKANEIMESFEIELKKKSIKFKEIKAQATRAENELSEIKLQKDGMAKQISEMVAELEKLNGRETHALTTKNELEVRIFELQKALEVSQSSVSYLTQKVTEQSRPFLRPSVDDCRGHPWVATTNGLSATAQALLRRTSEIPTASISARTSELTRLSSPNPQPYMDKLVAGQYTTEKIDLSSESKNAFLTPDAFYTTAKLSSGLDEEVPRNPISKTILPVKFKPNF